VKKLREEKAEGIKALMQKNKDEEGKKTGPGNLRH
jgi:hypothetical protein|tara:strand:- start:72 stop:176 length:105 start_codon:yes stop_codon:yes gene_type:complete